MATFTFTVNGMTYSREVDEDKPLLWVLREDLSHTGTKYGCGIAMCGACTVLVDVAGDAALPIGKILIRM